MYFHVFLKIFIIRESFITVSTLKRFFFSMYPHMLLKIFIIRESFITLSTLKRFFFSMYPHMLLKIIIIRESFITLSTLKRFFFSMYPHMLFKNVFTIVPLIRCSPSIYIYLDGNREILNTLAILVKLLPVIHPYMVCILLFF